MTLRSFFSCNHGLGIHTPILGQISTYRDIIAEVRRGWYSFENCLLPTLRERMKYWRVEYLKEKQISILKPVILVKAIGIFLPFSEIYGRFRLGSCSYLFVRTSSKQPVNLAHPVPTHGTSKLPYTPRQAILHLALLPLSP